MVWQQSDYLRATEWLHEKFWWSAVIKRVIIYCFFSVRKEKLRVYIKSPLMEKDSHSIRETL